MLPKHSLSSAPAFQPSQIVCLEHGSSRLYAEVVQVAEPRQVCWVRPLALVENDSAIAVEAPPELHDLRQGSDLLLPIALFRLAIDTEVMPVLSHLYAEDDSITSKAGQTKHQYLSQFVRQVCLAHRSLFTSASA
ncbi:MAG: hypothetical protein DCF22_11095 [Leptolyngbya sp.]|nr:MAG: hypothetical protein DCF22_11095 [Leptolyngbya sp.]